MVNIQDFRDLGTIKDLPPNEKEQYVKFLETTYKENLQAAEYLLIKFPRWSIITGYYAMHDITKLFLGKKYGLKLSAPQIHSAAITCLKELTKRKDILELLKKAEQEYEEITSLHYALIKGKEEREKSQYYTNEAVTAKVAIQKASYFLEKLVKPYKKLILELMK